MKNLDPVLWLLLAAYVLTLGVLVVVNKLFPQDGQIFQVIAGLATGWAAGFLLRVKPQTAEQEKTPGAKLEQTTTTVIKDPDPAQSKP